MHSKIRNTLYSLAIALSMLAASYGVGQAPQAATGDRGLAALTDARSAPDGRPARPGKRAQAIRRHISMPYFSFGPLLPRRES